MAKLGLSLLALALVGLQLACAHEEHLEVANKQVTIGDICANRQVPIISVDEARRLIHDLKKRPELCPANYVQSFYELEPILSLDSNERLCGERKFDQIKAYHFRYINPLVEDYRLGDDLNKLGKKIARRRLDEAKVDYTVQLDDFKQEILIPISLQQFFKAWALQVSGMCKRTLVDNLDKASQLFTDADFELIEQVAKGDAQAKAESIAGTPMRTQKLTFGELVYLPHLEGEIQPGDAELRDRLTVLDLRSKPDLDRLMHACKLRFKPVYDKLVMPIVRLSKLGYEYLGPKVDDIAERLEKDPEVKRWMALTLLCEAQGNFELTESEDPEQRLHMEPLDYDPMYNYRLDGELWIKGAEALSKELNRISGYKATGFKRFLFNSGVAGRKIVAFIDPHQFAWYRRNQNTLSSFLNIMSIASNTLSMTVG